MRQRTRRYIRCKPILRLYLILNRLENVFAEGYVSDIAYYGILEIIAVDDVVA